MAAEASAQPARFVVLRHECAAHSARPSHWDLMLEHSGKLLTWALSEAPGASGEMIAESLPDHRLAYLDYEGPVSGDRGEVTRWDRGTLVIQRRQDDEVVAVVRGQKLNGTVALVRLAGGSQRWRLTFCADPSATAAGPADALSDCCERSGEGDGSGGSE